MTEIDPRHREATIVRTTELLQALQALDDPPELSDEARRTITEHIAAAITTGARIGAREILAGIQQQFLDAGYDDVHVVIPDVLLAEND